MEKITCKAVKAAADRCNPNRPDEMYERSRPDAVLIKIEGLRVRHEEENLFELFGVPTATLGDLRPLMDNLVKDGFDREDVENAVDKFAADLRKRSLIRVLAERTQVLG